MTAAELIATRADASQPNMGLTSWKGAAVRRGDVTVAKNSLNQGEISGLNRIVTMWLDFADDQALRRKQVFPTDWTSKLDGFLAFNERAVLTGKDKVTKALADSGAKAAYETFAERRRALLEAEGERVQSAALEKAAKELPSSVRRSASRASPPCRVGTVLSVKTQPTHVGAGLRRPRDRVQAWRDGEAVSSTTAPGPRG